MVNPIQARYPTICDLLSGRRLEKDIRRAAELAAQPDGRDRLKQALRSKEFSSNRLVLFLACNTLLDEDDFTATGLVRDLHKRVGRIGLKQLKATYKDKLLSDEQFDDAVYEIAVTAMCSDFFDPDTLELEQRITGSRSGERNSDIKGVRGGQKYRVEVTVLHDDWPPRPDEGLQEIMEQAEIEAGYTVALARPVVSREAAGQVKRLIEELDAARRAAPGADLTVRGVKYLLCEGEYRPRRGTSPIDHITFEDATPFRLVGSTAIALQKPRNQGVPSSNRCSSRLVCA